MLLSKIKTLIYLNQDLVDNTTACYFIKIEFRYLYYYFSYPLVGCFHKILEHTSYKTNFEKLKCLIEYYK
jgi:hypothetical protein